MQIVIIETFASKLQQTCFIFDTTMRILAFILSLYFTALSIVPCADGMPSSSNHSSIEASMDEHDYNHSDHPDNCTPFCVCACCGSIVTFPIVQSTATTKSAISTKCLFHYTFYYSFNFSEGIWHPPNQS